MRTFRPVREIWGTHSASFLETDQLVTLLHDLAARVGTSSSEKTYGDVTAVWFEDGTKVLDYIATDSRFNKASFADSLEEQGVIVDKGDLNSLIGNMKTSVKVWRTSLGVHGELVFYID